MRDVIITQDQMETTAHYKGKPVFAIISYDVEVTRDRRHGEDRDGNRGEEAFFMGSPLVRKVEIFGKEDGAIALGSSLDMLSDKDEIREKLRIFADRYTDFDRTLFDD